MCVICEREFHGHGLAKTCCSKRCKRALKRNSERRISARRPPIIRCCVICRKEFKARNIRSAYDSEHCRRDGNLANQRRFREINPAKCREYTKRSRDLHRPKIRDRVKRWKKLHPEYVNAQNRLYRKRHPEQVRTWKLRDYSQRRNKYIKYSARRYQQLKQTKLLLGLYALRQALKTTNGG